MTKQKLYCRDYYPRVYKPNRSVNVLQKSMDPLKWPCIKLCGYASVHGERVHNFYWCIKRLAQTLLLAAATMVKHFQLNQSTIPKSDVGCLPPARAPHPQSISFPCEAMIIFTSWSSYCSLPRTHPQFRSLPNASKSLTVDPPWHRPYLLQALQTSHGLQAHTWTHIPTGRPIFSPTYAHNTHSDVRLPYTPWLYIQRDTYEPSRSVNTLSRLDSHNKSSP